VVNQNLMANFRRVVTTGPEPANDGHSCPAAAGGCFRLPLPHYQAGLLEPCCNVAEVSLIGEINKVLCPSDAGWRRHGRGRWRPSEVLSPISGISAGAYAHYDRAPR